MASFGLKVIRALFGAAEYVAPGLAGRAAFELFCRTPDAKALSEGERRAVERATGFMAQAQHHRLKTRTGWVAAYEFRPEPGRALAGTVLVLHGWRSRTDYMRALIEGFCQAGYRVLSLDLPGHGLSSGRRLTLLSAAEAVRLAGERFGPFTAVVGHSFGGLAATSAVAGSLADIPPLATKYLVLIAAPASLPVIFSTFSDLLKLGPRSQAAMMATVERLAGRPLQDFSGDRQLAAIGVPTLVIHAPDDREVSGDHARLYASAGDHVRLYWAEGLGHRRILADEGVVERAVGFIAEQQAVAELH
jgi:pimeloyl-ACP methyl ester carboxylesterase